MTVGELLVKMGVDQSEFDRAMSKSEGQAKTAGIRIGDIFKNAFSVTIGMGMFEALKAGFKSTIGTAINFNSMLQNARIGFETMLGSAEKAQAFLDQMGKFAAQTPFEYPELLEVSQRMMALGFSADEVLPTLKSIGDAMAALGRGTDGIQAVIYALGQMRMAGRVNAQDMMQLTNAGIPAWEILAQSIGKTVAETRKLAENGLIPADKAVQALINGMEKRFPDMMKKMENSWMGVTSTIKDIWRMTIGTLTQGLFNGVNQWLIKVRDFAQQFYNSFQAGKFKSIAVGFANFWSMLKIATMSGAYGIMSVMSTIFRLIPGMGDMFANSANAIAAAIAKERAVMQARSTAIQTATAAGQNMATSTQEATSSIEEQTDAIKDANKSAVKNLQSFDEVHQIQENIADSADEAANSIMDIATAETTGETNTVGNGPEQTVDAESIKSPFADITGWYASMWQGIQNIFRSGMEVVKGIWFGDWDKVRAESDILFSQLFGTDVSEKMAGMAVKIGQKLNETGTIIANGWITISDILAQIFGGIYTIASTIWDGIKNYFIQNSSDTSNSIITAWDSINATLQTIFSTIQIVAQTVFDALKTFWQTHGTDVTNIFIQTWALIVQALSTVWTTLSSAVQVVFGAIKEFFSQNSESIKQTLINTWNTVMLVLASVWNVIYDVAMAVFGALQGFWEEHGDSVKEFLVAAWELIWAIIKPIWDTMTNAAESIFGALQAFWNEWGDNITKFFSDTFNFIGDIFAGLLDVLTGLLKIFTGVFTGDWEKVWEGVKKIFDGIWNNMIMGAFDWGKNLVQNIIDGIKSMISKVADAAKGVADSIKSFLGFHSPAEEGPGRYADQWAPNLMQMYVNGILNNIGLVRAAAATVAENLSGMAIMPAPAFTGATGSITARGYTQSSAQEIHLHIGTLVADDYGLKKLEQKLKDIRIFEEQRMGGTR